MVKSETVREYYKKLKFNPKPNNLILMCYRTTMKNSECTIYIMFKDKWIQKFKKGEEGWILTTAKGTLHPCSAEQLLSHILPAIAGIKGRNVTVKVEPDHKLET
jgi:hypothetical protein